MVPSGTKKNKQGSSRLYIHTFKRREPIDWSQMVIFIFNSKLFQITGKSNNDLHYSICSHLAGFHPFPREVIFELSPLISSVYRFYWPTYSLSLVVEPNKSHVMYVFAMLCIFIFLFSPFLHRLLLFIFCWWGFFPPKIPINPLMQKVYCSVILLQLKVKKYTKLKHSHLDKQSS